MLVFGKPTLKLLYMWFMFMMIPYSTFVGSKWLGGYPVSFGDFMDMCIWT